MDGVTPPSNTNTSPDGEHVPVTVQAPTPVEPPTTPSVISSPQSAQPFVPIQASEVEAEIASTKPGRGLSMPSFGAFGTRSHMYLVEYLVSLFMLWTLLVVIVTAFSLVTEYLADKNSSVFGGEGGSAAIMALLAATIISLPIYILTSIRTRRSEFMKPTVMQNKWRKGFLYVTLVIVALNGVTYASVLMYNILNNIFVGDSVNWGKDWPGIVNTLFVVVLLCFVYWSYVKVNDTPSFQEDEL